MERLKYRIDTLYNSVKSIKENFEYINDFISRLKEIYDLCDIAYNEYSVYNQCVNKITNYVFCNGGSGYGYTIASDYVKILKANNYTYLELQIDNTFYLFRNGCGISRDSYSIEELSKIYNVLSHSYDELEKMYKEIKLYKEEINNG